MAGWTYKQDKLDGAPNEGHGRVAVDKHLDDLAQLGHSFNELCDPAHVLLLPLRSKSGINVQDRALDVLAGAAAKVAPLLFSQARRESGDGLVEDVVE
jgi:hypothetical protein